MASGSIDVSGIVPVAGQIQDEEVPTYRVAVSMLGGDEKIIELMSIIKAHSGQIGGESPMDFDGRTVIIQIAKV